jgi:hypothetical protein
MANPTFGSMKVDKILTQFSIAYRNEDYISEMILPVLKVKQRSGKFAKYGKENLKLEDNLLRAPGARARTMDYSVSQGSYTCEEHAIEKLVPDEFAANTDDPYDARRDATLFAVDKLWGHQENALATDMANTGIITQNTTLSGTSQWSDYSLSDPLSDMRTARTTIKTATGKTPNVAVFGWETWLQLQNHPDIVDRVKSVGSTSIEAMKMAVAQLLEVKTVLIGDAIKNTAVDGQADSLAFVWGKHAWLLHVAPRPSLMTPSFGYTMKDLQRVVDGYRDDPRVGDVVRVRDSFDQTLIDVELAYLIKDAIA